MLGPPGGSDEYVAYLELAGELIGVIDDLQGYTQSKIVQAIGE